jgi:4-hydroxy-3-methylbut-2-enyl diphosphate reductase
MTACGCGNRGFAWSFNTRIKYRNMTQSSTYLIPVVDIDAMTIEIDEKAGFCGGVRRAITLVEKSLKAGKEIYARGELLHNRREMQRLQEMGLRVTDGLEAVKNKQLFIRTHGEGKHVLAAAEQLGVEIVDATCPKVKVSQEIIDKAYQDGFQIVIVGKEHHPEVTALMGFCDGQGIVIYHTKDLLKVDVTKKTILIGQTTVPPEVFRRLRDSLISMVPNLTIHDTMCSFVTNRERELEDFAGRYDVVVFVGGKHSSNSRMLYTVCRRINSRSHFVESDSELKRIWFENATSVGITGSASTPLWQIEDIKKSLLTLLT